MAFQVEVPQNSFFISLSLSPSINYRLDLNTMSCWSLNI